MKKVFKAIAIVLSIIVLTVSLAQKENQTLSDEAQEALLEALIGTDGEYAAFATYAAVLETYGDVEPYSAILQSETKHINALQRQLDKYDVAYPENPYLGKVELPDSLETFARVGVEAEVNNVSLYDELLKSVANHPDLIKVFGNLQRASQVAHLPLFEAAAEQGGTLTAEQMSSMQTEIHQNMQLMQKE